MIKLYPYDTLGLADFGWLKARYHFSFARYWNPDRQAFGNLRVINDDIVAAGRGFASHRHDNMEIITYVRKGAITHTDSIGNEGRTSAGEVQVMSAGSGVAHSERNREDEETSLYQIWIEPDSRDVAPRWDMRAFPKEPVDRLPVLVSGRPEDAESGALLIHQDAALYGGNLVKGTAIRQEIRHQAYILASSGSFSVNGTVLNQGDGAEVTDEVMLEIVALSDCEIIVIDVP